MANYLQAVGIRTQLRLMERAAYYKEYADKKLRGLLHTGSGAPGNAATRIDSYAVTGGAYVYNTYPEIDGLFSEQVNEQNPRVRDPDPPEDPADRPRPRRCSPRSWNRRS